MPRLRKRRERVTRQKEDPVAAIVFVRLPKDQRDALKVKAKSLGLSVNMYVRMLIFKDLGL